MELKFVSVTSNSVTLRTSKVVKNHTSQRSYILEYWPGDTKLSGSIFMDPKVALLSWLTVLGGSYGFVFCDSKVSGQEICELDP